MLSGLSRCNVDGKLPIFGLLVHRIFWIVTTSAFDFRLTSTFQLNIIKNSFSNFMQIRSESKIA